MLDLFNIPTPQTANYQEFYGGIVSGRDSEFTWIKPRGCSMVRFLLIGAGGGGGNGNTTTGGGGGGSGAITSWIGPAIFIPDSLQIRVGKGGGVGGIDGQFTAVYYYSPLGAYELLKALGGVSGIFGTGGSGGSAMPANYFTASGIFNTVAGQSGANGSSTGAGGNVSASTTTFLSGGAGGAGAAASTGGRVTPNYGYTALPNTTAGGTVAGANGYFITQPILVGCGGAGGTTSTSVGTTGGAGGIGCGGGGAGEDNSGGQYERRGGNGAVFVWAW
jgi:hypothetical protein